MGSARSRSKGYFKSLKKIPIKFRDHTDLSCAGQDLQWGPHLTHFLGATCPAMGGPERHRPTTSWAEGPSAMALLVAFPPPGRTVFQHAHLPLEKVDIITFTGSLNRSSLKFPIVLENH